MDQIKLLHQEELFSNLVVVGSLMKSVCSHNPDFLNPAEKYQLFVYYADALYDQEEYRKAESVYEEAIQIKKAFQKTKDKTQDPRQKILQQSWNTEGLPSEIDVRYKIHKCLVKLKNYREAITTLEAIPAKLRKPKVNMALAKLYEQFGKERPATTAYKEVLRQCPLGLHAAIGLFSLGVKGTEVASLTISSFPNAGQLEWLNFWLKGHAYSASKEYAKAVSTFKSLETGTVLRDNINVLCCLAENYFLLGDYTNAGLVYQRIHCVDPLNTTGMDFYAFILHKEKKSMELQSLASKLMSVTDRKPEPWIAMGYHALISGPRKACRTVYFANKAHELCFGQIEALLLKGRALLQMGRTLEATLHFREAVRHAPHRFEAHQGLVDCYIKANRIREAMTTFSNSYNVLGSSPRTLTALASVFMKDRLTLDKAKSSLEKALAEDDTYLEAVYLLVNVLTEQDNINGAIELLRKHVEQQSSSQLHQMLADLLAKTKDLLGASHHYNIAISLDPSNTKAVQGLQRVENNSDLEGGMEEDVEAVEESSEETEFDTSDNIGPWAETEWLS
ncbi:Anaphase-promoting complex subunit 7 [Holothuria leucospilota]|uniref:Anaphase-promoting complex subunit 7 n=1 Tax=Holothuria leucospilota TaxID=206669 RepID=A0A9Q1CDF0_HOLLE|nr:Anaphase-promoting complex subunit 7 [Holothuria leucospilota]